jgi:ABC-2 type transport system permease protein
MMRKVLELARLNLLQLVRDRGQLLSMIGLPLVLTLLFGLVSGGGERRVPVALADGDRTEYSREVMKALPSTSYNVRSMSVADAEEQLSLGQVAAAVLLPKGLGADLLAGRDIKIIVEEDPRNTSSLAIAQAIRGAAQRMAGNGIAMKNVAEMYGQNDPRTAAPEGVPVRHDVYEYALRKWEPQPPVSVRAVDVQRSAVRGASQEAQGFAQYSMGFTVMFMMFMALSGAGGFLEEREMGTFPRLLTTPTNAATLVGGKLTGIFVTTIAQAGAMVVIGATLFGVAWGRDPLAVAAVLIPYGLAATGLSIAVSTMVRTRSQMAGLSPILAVSMAMLGGCYWPVDIVSPLMRDIGSAVPTYWAMQGLTSVVVRNQGLAAAATPALILVGFAILFFSMGLALLRFE